MMNLKTTHSFFQNLQNDNLCFGYQGTFNDEITNRVIDLSENNINLHVELSKMKNKVSFLMAECFQNIVRHGELNKDAVKDSSESTGLFLTRNINDTFIISSGNLIHDNLVDDLSSKLEKVNALDLNELRSTYLDVLTKEGMSEKGGAGLGLLEMARRSKQKLEFAFKKMGKNLSFFYLQINFRKKEEKLDIPIEEAIEFHQLMKKHYIMLFHKGNYSQESIIPILRMIEDNLHCQCEQLTIKKRVYHILVEVLQNISIHSCEVEGKKQGIFTIGKRNNKYVVTAGNYVSNEKIPSFRKQLQMISELNRPELKQMYLDKLREERVELRNNAGLGLIDIARESSEHIEFDFFEVDDRKSFFTIGVKI